MKGFSRVCTRGKIVAAAGLVAALGVLAPSVAVADDAAVTTLTAPETTDQAATPTDASERSAAETDNATTVDAPETTEAPAAQVAGEDVVTQNASATPSLQASSDNQTVVAKIDNVAYASLDEAIAASKDGDTIDLSGDAQIATTNFIAKRVTVRGNGHTVTVAKQPGTEGGDLTIEGSGSLTFDNANVTFAGGGKWAVTMRDSGKLSFENGATATFTQVGIYTVGAGCSINVNASTMTFDGTSYTAIMNEYKGGQGYASINVTNGSNLTVENVGSGNNGITGFIVNVIKSQLHVDDNANQGLVRCTTTLDASTATISGNDIGITGYRGLDNLTLKNGSTLEMSGNKSAGIFLWGGNVDVQAGTSLSITGTGAAAEQGAYTGAICTYYYGTDYRSHVTLADGATVSLVNNPVGAINNGGEMYVGAGTTITGNGANAENGGGILNTGKIAVADGARLYNNHAKTSGDDICNATAADASSCGTIDFAATGDGWQLDSELGNCGHVIDGWYVDAAGSRWSAHSAGKHVETALEGSYSTPLALKAAHGLVCVDYKYVGEVPDSAQLPDMDVELEMGLPYNAKTQDGVDGWAFDGWYTDEACTQKWEDGAELAGSMTLFGKWTKDPVAPSAPETPSTPVKPAEAAKKPRKQLPQTSDDTSTPLGLLAGAAAALAAGLALRKRSK